MTAVGGELWIIDCFFGDLEARWTRSEKAAAPAPIQFHLGLSGTRHKERQSEPKKVVPLDHVRVALLNRGSELLQRRVLGFLRRRGINHDQLFPSRVVGKR